jgi:hypothetical protein
MAVLPPMAYALKIKSDYAKNVHTKTFLYSPKATFRLVVF